MLHKKLLKKSQTNLTVSKQKQIAVRKILTFIVVVLAMLACKGGEESSVSSPLQAIDFVQEDGAEVKIDNGVD